MVKFEWNNGIFEKIVLDIFCNGSVFMFVISLIIVVVLYSNVFSFIIFIWCFSIYVGIVVLCNFFFVVMWMLVFIVIYEKWCNCEKFYDFEFF